MSKWFPLGFALLVAAAALAAAGCGGSSRNKAYANSKADFAAAMNSVCAKVNAAAKAAPISSVSDLATKGPALLKVEQDAIKKLKSLEPPAEIKTNVDHFISAVSQATSTLGDAIKAAKKNDTAKVSTLGQQANTQSKSADPDATAIGAPACLSTAT